MSDYLFDPGKVFALAVHGETAAYPVHRVFCVGRNYAAHAAEMGAEVDREAPWYFTKSAAHAVASGATVPYPPGTANFHYEMELTVAIGAPVFRATAEEAAAAIYAYGCGLDMTRRDRQQDGKDKGRPWCLGKDVEDSAVFAPLTKAAEFGDVADQRIHLAVDGVIKQDATLRELVWSCVEVVEHLSTFYHLSPGDMIMTGTPAGVGPVVAGSKITGGIDTLDPIDLTIAPAA
ncbi:MAG: fumarylacetoacetate hydrolase family protein [Pseudomonadota bacterium]